MSGKEQICYVGPTDNYAQALGERLKSGGHEMIASVETLAEVESLLQDGQTKVTLAFICHDPDKDMGEAVQLFKAKYPDIKIVSLGDFHLLDWGDVRLTIAQRFSEILGATKNA